jgi:predicted DNA binding CopG/RHH family protein
MSKLEKDEKELLDSVEAGEWRSAPDRDREVSRYREYAAATFKKDRRINIRISSKDLNALQKRALREGIPYQTLVASVLHKYVSGQFHESDT